jgi:hypothetical protein
MVEYYRLSPKQFFCILHFYEDLSTFFGEAMENEEGDRGAHETEGVNVVEMRIVLACRLDFRGQLD